MITEKETKFTLEMDEEEFKRFCYLVDLGARTASSRNYSCPEVKVSLTPPEFTPIATRPHYRYVKTVKFRVDELTEIPERLMRLLYGG